MREPISAEARLTDREPVSEHVRIGPRLRARREQQGMSLRELARRLGVSPSAISKIETEKYRPSVSTLWSIVSELGMSLDELFGAAPERRRFPRPTRGPAVSRAGSRDAAVGRRVQRVQHAASRKVVELDSGVTWERLTPTSDPEADFLFVRYDVGGSSSKSDSFIRHSGREYGLVLRGTLEVTVGFDTHVLAPGDSIAFESTTPHRLRNIGEEPVEGIWVVVGRYEADRQASREH
jgi:transcriptional regulator with XRE-family HTH domain